MGEHVNSSVRPRYRAKSPERIVDEISRLVKAYDRKYLCFVDPTFNVDGDLQARIAEEILKRRLGINFSAWLRSDGIVGDEENGVLEKVVRAGLNEAYIGIEHYVVRRVKVARSLSFLRRHIV